MDKNIGRKIKVLDSDNGGECTDDPFQQLCHDEDIEGHFTMRETPQQNSVAEIMNMTLLEKVRCMLSKAELSKSFWAEALAHGYHLINRLPSSAIGGKFLLKV